MAEDSESQDQDTGAEPAHVGVDPAAMALALAGAGRAEANAFLTDQRALIIDQRHYLRERYKRLVEQVEETRLKLWELRLGVLLRAGTLCVGLAAVTAVGILIWDSERADGLVIEAFAVPPDLANRGISGDVVAAQMLDRLAALQEATDSARAAQSYANNWGDNIKVEIPETGISIGELRRLLREWLGHETRITGEIFRTTTGLAVTARAGGTAGATFTGAETDLDGLIQKAAEQIYSKTQPYRYANYLDHNRAVEGRGQRLAQAAAIFRKLIDGNDPRERAWAWYGLGVQVYATRDSNRDSIPLYRKSAAAYPDFTPGYYTLAQREFFLDSKEIALADARVAARLLHRDVVADVNPGYLANARESNDAHLAYLLGDYGAAAHSFRAGAERPDKPYGWASISYFQWWGLVSLARQHDGVAVRGYMRDQGLDKIAYNPAAISGYIIEAYAGLENWRAIVALEGRSLKALDHWRREYPVLLASLALAKAELGDVAGAERLIAVAPANCDECLITRGSIAELQGQHGRADYWFDRAEHHASSTPFADTEWGRALTSRGQPDAAIGKFKSASRKSPHFADPLEGWGEALMAQNRSDLALAKFADAEKYAPNWGRLHLKWGEALAYAGKRDAARTQFARAARLDLTPAETAGLGHDLKAWALR